MPFRRHLAPTALFSLLLFSLATAAPAEPGPWEFLSTSAIGADAFREAHPEWDGRGVVIAVLDTGVDPGLAGLATTSAGEVKIVDLRDFSGQGDVALEAATIESDAHGVGVRGGEGRWLRGLEELEPAPDEGTLLVGYLKEEDLVNSAARDLDGDGRTDGIYGVVVYGAGGSAGMKRSIVVDTDGDGRLDDEEVRGDFLEDPRPFVLGAEGRREGSAALSLALNLWEDEDETVTFVFDDGAHGSHVAGIAAGHRIGGQEGQDGIAPGARILSLKLGDNTLSGGATTPGSMWRAWHWAADYAREQSVPVMIQMSYGVGSENEGEADMEAEIDRLLEANEPLMGFVSNGNTGPGLSSSGLPSCAKRLMASAAVLNRSTAKDVYGVDLAVDRLFYFSARGGEMPKPDVSAPGFSASTVPPWREGSDVMRGTSMASPQTAGAAALLASAALAEDLPVVGAWLRAALRRGARPLPEATVLDQGPGMVDVGRAWEVYRALATRPAPEPLDWTVETASPDAASGMGPAAYWRGVRPPLPPDQQEVTVSPRFRDPTTDAEVADFYRAFELVSTAGWVSPSKRSVYTRSGRPMSFGLVYDGKALAEPGLYTARILAYEKGLSASERERLGPEWDLPVSVVVGERPAPGETLALPTARLAAGAIERRYVHVPLGAGGVELEATVPEGTRERARVFLFDPEGRRHILPRVGSDYAHSTSYRVAGRDLAPGVWEIVRYAHYGNDREVPVDLALRFDGYLLETGPVVLEGREGAPPGGSTFLLNRSDRTFEGSVRASLVGHRLSSEEKIGPDPMSLDLPMGPGVAAVEIRASMSAESWNRFTDVAVRILDGEGEALLSDGMSYAVLDTHLDNPAAGGETGSYTLQVIAAVADPSDSGTTPLTLERTYRYTEPIPVAVSGDEEIALYPDREATLDLEAARTPPTRPEGAVWVLELILEDARDPARSTTLELTAE